MIFDKSFRPREPTAKSATSTTSTQTASVAKFLEFLGLEGFDARATGDATYFACLRVLSESMGKLPLKLVKKSEDDGTVQMRKHPYYDALRVRPNPFVTSTGFNTSMELACNEYGNSFAWIQPDKKTVKIWQLPSKQVRVWWDNAMLLSEVPHIWYIWHASNGKTYKFSDDEIIHFQTWFSMDGICGLPVRDILKLTIDGALKSQAMLNKMYENGMTGKAVLQYTGDINDDKTKTFVAGIERFIDGTVTGAKSLIPVPLGSTITPLDIKLADGQYLELRKFTALQVAAAFGVKPDQINDYSKSSYSSSESQQLSFLVESLLWRIKRNEEELSYKLLNPEERANGLTVEYNTGVLLRADTKTQIDALKSAVDSSIYRPNEARSFLGMSADPDGNRLICANGSTIPLADAGKQYDRKGGN